MSTSIEPYRSPAEVAGEPLSDYRALSSAAVACLLIGLLSGLTFLSPFLAVVPVLGVIAGVWALIQTRRRADELTGRALAWIGLTLSAFSLVGGLASAAVIYATELKPGYTRISYTELQPIEGTGQAIPASARQLDGKQVFIKGYMYPGKQTHGLKRFLLVRDKGSCCFGGNPKITDRIEVTLKEPLRCNFNDWLNKVHGTFHVGVGDQAVDAGGAVYYHLDADSVD